MIKHWDRHWELYVVGLFLATFGILWFHWEPPIIAQQPPYALYPIEGIADTVLGPLPISECLVVTAQGFAVVLPHSCPK